VFIFSLAERLGMSVADLLDRIDVAELVEWMAYARLRADPKAFNSVDENLMDVMRSSIAHGKR
jgi:hypothetical protein